MSAMISVLTHSGMLAFHLDTCDRSSHCGRAREIAGVFLITSPWQFLLPCQGGRIACWAHSPYRNRLQLRMAHEALRVVAALIVQGRKRHNVPATFKSEVELFVRHFDTLCGIITVTKG